MRTALDQLVRAPHGLPVAGEVVGQRRPRARPPAEASTSAASSASSAGGGSPIGEPVPRLPPRVAPLRISRDANCGNSCVEQRDPPGEAALDLGQGERGADLDASSGPTSSSRSSGSRSMPTISAAPGVPRRLTSTPQSVRPGDQPGVRVARPAARGPRPGRRAGRSAPLRRSTPWWRPAAGAGRVSRAGERVVGRGRRRGRRRRPGSAGSRCSGTGCRSARAGRSRSGRARGRPRAVPCAAGVARRSAGR